MRRRRRLAILGVFRLACASRFAAEASIWQPKIFAEGMKGDVKTSQGKMGLVLDVGGYYKNVFTIAPSFTITEPEMDLAMELFEQLIRRCTKK